MAITASVLWPLSLLVDYFFCCPEGHLSLYLIKTPCIVQPLSRWKSGKV